MKVGVREGPYQTTATSSYARKVFWTSRVRCEASATAYLCMLLYSDYEYQSLFSVEKEEEKESDHKADDSDEAKPEIVVDDEAVAKMTESEVAYWLKDNGLAHKEEA